MNEKVEFMKQAKKIVETIENIQLKKVGKIKEIDMPDVAVIEFFEQQKYIYIALYNYHLYEQLDNIFFSQVESFSQQYLSDKNKYIIRIYIYEQKLAFIEWVIN